MRQNFVIVHRYVGLLMALFLVIAGFTGMLIAFYDELEALLLPELVLVAPVANQPMLAPMVLNSMMQKQYPDAMFNRVNLHQEAGKSVRFHLRPKLGLPQSALSNNEIFVNPYTGKILGERKWGDLSQGVINLLPFVYRLHFSLALGDIGEYALGIIALLWTIDCFVGAYLTFPAKPRRKQNPQPSITSQSFQHISVCKKWLSLWAKAWKIRFYSGFSKLNFDLHRASSLWLWAMLFVFAWSSVAFNLREVHNPVMQSLFATQKAEKHLPSLAQPLLHPTLTWPAAIANGQKLMQQLSVQKHFKINREGYIDYNANKGVYRYSVNSSRDLSPKSQRTSVTFDANSGRLLALYLPTGEASGNTIAEWMLVLHIASIWGLPMQIFVSLMGLVVVSLAMTGLIIWQKKRKSRKLIKRLKLS